MSINITLVYFFKFGDFQRARIKLALIYYMSFNCYLVIGIKGFAGY